jgi:cell division protein FtsW
MGIGTSVNTNRSHNLPQPAARPASVRSQRPAWVGLDLPLLVIVIILAVFGIVMVYSASADFSFQNTTNHSETAIFFRQLQWLGLGSIGMLFLILMDYHWLRKLAIPLMLVTLVMLTLVLFGADERYGAVRSLFNGSVQPSELAKLSLIIYLAIWLYNRSDQIRQIRLWILPLGVIMGVLGGMILLQPDLSAVMTIVILGSLMIYLAGGGGKQLFIVLGLGTIVGLILLRSGIFPTGPDRLGSYIGGLEDPLNYSPHVRLALQAFIRGGWFGVGIGMSQLKLIGLPFPHTDSIFAVVGEELGVVGAASLMMMYLLLGWRGLVIARRAPDKLGALLASGLSIWLVTEAFINMLVMVGLMPFAGNALPFISAGGSSLIMTMAAIGIILNVSRQSVKQKSGEERLSHAAVDLRRRDRRRRVSRPVRPAGPAVQN